jgi:hypothetical protein
LIVVSVVVSVVVRHGLVVAAYVADFGTESRRLVLVYSHGWGGSLHFVEHQKSASRQANKLQLQRALTGCSLRPYHLSFQVLRLFGP